MLGLFTDIESLINEMAEMAAMTQDNDQITSNNDDATTVDTGIDDEGKDQCYKAFVFAHQFYPTPKKIADKMAEELKRDRDIKLVFPVLDPSAGKGNLLDAIAVYIDKYDSDRKNQLRGIEIDPDLAATLKGKEYLLVGNDFLAFNERECCPSIIMNPPFSSGLAHIFHAWEITQTRGTDRGFIARNSTLYKECKAGGINPTPRQKQKPWILL